MTAPSAVHLTNCFSPDSQHHRLSVEASLPLSPLQRFSLLNYLHYITLNIFCQYIFCYIDSGKNVHEKSSASSQTSSQYCFQSIHLHIFLYKLLIIYQSFPVNGAVVKAVAVFVCIRRVINIVVFILDIEHNRNAFILYVVYR